MQNKVTLEGRVTYDVKTFPMKTGGHLFIFTLSVTDTTTGSGGKEFSKYYNIPVKVFATDSAGFMQLIQKGADLRIEGKIVEEKYDYVNKEGKQIKGQKVLVIAEDITSLDSGETISLEDLPNF